MSKPDTWMPLLIGNYMADTTHLTTEQHGAYLLLLMTAWMRSGYLPNDDDQLAAICKLDAKNWQKTRKVLLPFFTIENDQLTQKRLMAEYQSAVIKNNAQKRNGSLGGRPKKNPTHNPNESQQKPTGYVWPNPTDNPTHNPNESPIPIPVNLPFKNLVGTREEADGEVGEIVGWPGQETGEVVELFAGGVT